MSKKETKEEVKEVKQEASKGPKLGQFVHYHKQVQTGQGPKMKAFLALVIGFADKVSNFQPQDHAVCLYVFTAAQGGSNEVKSDVMIAKEPQHGRYTIPND